MLQDTYKVLHGALRNLLREKDTIGHNSQKVAHGYKDAGTLIIDDDHATVEEIIKVEQLIVDNFANGWDDCLYRKCAPGGSATQAPF